jgi:hypothetical protein
MGQSKSKFQIDCKETHASIYDDNNINRLSENERLLQVESERQYRAIESMRIIFI